MNLASVLLGPARTAPDSVAIRAQHDVTYGDLALRAGRLARLLSDDVRTGERVALLASNDESFVVAYLATLACGAVAVPLNPSAPAPELGRELALVEPALVLRGPDVGAQLAAPDVAAVVSRVVDVSDPAGDGLEPLVPVPRDDDDLAVLLFTAGTSGAPRAAMLSHGNLGANIAQLQSHPSTRRTSDDVVLGVLPFFHVYGLNVVIGVALAVGASIVPVAHFDARDTAHVVEREAVTVIAAVPTIYRSWLELPDDTVTRATFASVRLAVSGAAPLDPQLASAFHARFGVTLHDGYGLTETSPVVTTSVVGDIPRAGSIGVAIPGVDVRLVDADGTDVLVGDPGEIWVRGPNVFRGYWRDDAATAAACTDDGWLRTGDVAVADDEGSLRLVDRLRDLVIVSGFNVFPAEVEDVLGAHPDVRDVAVVGVPDPRTGERLRAYVVPERDRVTDDETLRRELASHAHERLARYKCPDEIEVTATLPRGLSGKLLRRRLER
ncbi:MAG TPA: AMP-binding protein [Acidimicrobiia bacterium]|nr:AMP-binding protein [Acidimicrobiia bacterium]